GLLVRSASRSANNLGKATVTALKVVEIAITTISSDTTTRHMSRLATRACAADGDGEDAGNDGGKAPAEILPDHAGHQRRGCDAEIAPDAVQPHLAAEL